MSPPLFECSTLCRSRFQPVSVEWVYLLLFETRQIENDKPWCYLEMVLSKPLLWVSLRVSLAHFVYNHPSAPLRQHTTHCHTHTHTPILSTSRGSNTTLSSPELNSSSKDAKSATANRVRHQSTVEPHSLGTSFFPVPRRPSQCARYLS